MCDTLCARGPSGMVYAPAFPRTVAGPPPFVPFELSSEELWQAADAVRRRVEDDPDALAVARSTLDVVEDELWAEADDVSEHPGRWASVGASWGARAHDGLRACIHELGETRGYPGKRAKRTPTRQGGTA